MENKEYFSHSAISKSDLDLLAKSPFHLRNKSLFRKETTSMNLGSAVHKLVLEPNDFDKEFLVIPEINKRTKDGRAEYDAIISANKDKMILTHDEFVQAQLMSIAVLKNPAAKNNLSNGVAETPYFSTLSDVEVKCKPDYHNLESKIILDLKTTRDASQVGFRRSVKTYNYDMQAAYYTDILQSINHEVQAFIFIAVESFSPFLVGCYVLDDILLKEGRNKYLYLLELYKKCVEHGNWYGYADLVENELFHIRQISISNYKLSNN